jgi:hypothetical protein
VLGVAHDGKTVAYRGSGDAVCTVPELPQGTRVVVANESESGVLALEPQLPVYPLPPDGHRVVLRPGDRCEVGWCENSGVRVPR